MAASSPALPADGAKIIDLIHSREAAGATYIAFEYFPPRTADGVTTLYKRFKRMATQHPLYADVTWGAGGGTSDLTLELCVKMRSEYGMEPNMHLTCTNMEVSKIKAALEGAKAHNIRNIVALRGDPPKGQEEWKATEGGFNCALDLVKHIRKEYGDYFSVSVAGYPEGHPNVITKIEPEQQDRLSPSELRRVVTRPDGQYVCTDAAYAGELAYLKAKVDAGADMIITQMFFDVEVFLAFVSDCRGVGITVPILPGIMIISAYGGFTRMVDFCKSRVPREVRDAIEAVKDSEKDVKALGLQLGVAMSRRLIAAKCLGLHFYTLNQDEGVFAILDELGLKKTLPAELADS